MATAAVAGAGLGLKTYGTWRAAQDQADAAAIKAELQEREASEIAYRQAQNDVAARIMGRQFQQKQAAAFAKAGVDVGTGAPLSVMEATAYSIQDQINKRNAEAAYRINSLRYEAADMRRQGRDIKEAGFLSAFGGALLGAADIAQKAPGTGAKNDDYGQNDYEQGYQSGVFGSTKPKSYYGPYDARSYPSSFSFY